MSENYIAYVNSYNKLVPTDSTSNFTVLINLPKNNNFHKVVVSQLSIPKSFYLVQNGYNTFNIQELGINKLITINVGNYSKSKFLVELNRAILASSCIWSYVVSFTLSTGKFTYTVSSNSAQPS